MKLFFIIIVSWCAAFIIVMGSWLPKVIEAPYPYRFEIEEVKK